MKPKFNLIAGILAAAALSTGIAASAVSVSDVSKIVSRDEAREAAIPFRNTSEWYAAFEEALLEGRSPVDPLYAAYNRLDVDDEDEIMPAYLESSSSDPADVQLALIHDDHEYGYNLWSGRFIVDDVSSFAAQFTEPYTMVCSLYPDTLAQLDYKTGYSVNYKTLSGNYTYVKNGKRVTIPAVIEAESGYLQPIYPLYTGSGKLIEKAYYFYLYRGDSTSDFWDVVVIHVVDKDYAETEEYAALPYGGLIGSYTYVDTESMGVMPLTAE